MMDRVEYRDSGTPGAIAMAVLTSRGKPADPIEPPVAIPPLENGDRLSRAEFERRYDAMPDLKKAELLEGEVYVSSPVRHRQHGKPHGQVMTWIGTYTAGTPGVEAGDNGSVRLDLDNEPQPDVYLMIEPERGGQARISEDDYIEDAPELVAEVAASSVSYDLGKKLHVYRRNEVREYIVWRVQDRAVDWFVLRDGIYQPLAPGADGLLRSEVFPGLWLDPAALLRGDLATVLAVVQQGLASPEHAEFVARLQGV
jgi:Uma2 family endonuclease